MNYQNIQPGSTRLVGDEQRMRLAPNYKSNDACTQRFVVKENFGLWTPVKSLLGRVILASDLIHLEFRRPF